MPMSRGGADCRFKRRDAESINVALLGATPSNSGGIASWTDRMLTSPYFSSSRLFLVDERIGDENSVFSSGRPFVAEVKRCFRIWRDLRGRITESDIDIVHSNTPASTTSLMREIVCALIAKQHGCAFIGHFHCTVPVVVKSKINRLFFRKYLKLCDAAIVLNDQSDRFVAQLTGRPVFLIPNFVKDSEISSTIKDFSLGGPVRFVLYAGGIIEEKGVFEILDAARLCPDVEFRLAGSGKLPSDTLVPGNVKILGSLGRNELRNEYLKADVFLFLTHFPAEGFSCALLEAMASGLPCVVTDWAANKEMIGNQGGFVVEVGDSEGVCAALRELGDSTVREEMGKRNIQVVKSAYSERAVIERYEMVYGELCGVDSSFPGGWS